MTKRSEPRVTRLNVTRLDRKVRARLLGVGEHRPRSAEGALHRDELAQTLLYAQALGRKRESLVHKRRLGVDRSYAFHALQKMDPERRGIIEASARAFAEWYRATIK